MTGDPLPFDVCAELPTGTLVLEASAGTGKTYTIAALAARYVAEGRAQLGELMMVTFGRMATDELRVRVRERLVRTEAQLAGVLAGGAPPPAPDQVGQLLCTGSGAELAARHARIGRALTEFDAATIATTHEFCLRMLDGLGVLGDREPDAVFVEQLSDLTAEVSRDVYLRRYAAAGDPPLPFKEAQQLAQVVVGAGHTSLVPTPGTAGTDAAERRVAYASEVRAEVQRRKEAARLFSYDDMLTRLRDALAHPEHGEQAAARLRARYRVVLVDEFQDTDPVQWELVRRAFHGHSTVILIGDPKQAIYAFRGADVYSYLDAVRQADRVATLSTNWRSDEALTRGLETIMGGSSLGEEAIVVRPVGSFHAERRLRAPDGGEPLPPVRLRVVPPDPDPERVARVGQVRPVIEADLVADITENLADPPLVRLADGERPLQPSDIAVLVRSNDRGAAIRDALAEAGIPAVMLGSDSVFQSPVAREWLTLLGALEQPRQALARQAALTCFVGWTVTDLATADDAALTGLSARIRWWSRVLANRGVAALVEVVTTDARLAERLVSVKGGERSLTDLRHIGQALHAAMVSGRLGVSALVEWLRERMAAAGGEGWSDGTRRLETDAQAVQVLTLHRSKGLEFPVVYLPEAWDTFVRSKDEGQVLRLHTDGVCVLDVGGVSGAGRLERLARDQAEDAGEDLRLLYVGLTRAQCQVVTWWAATAQNTEGSALHRFLFRGRREGEPERRYPMPSDPVAALGLGPEIAVEAVEERPPVPAGESATPTAELAVRRFDRELDVAWRRTSYSALTAPVYGTDAGAAGVGSEAEPTKEDDEAADAPLGAVAMAPDEALAAPSPMQDLPSGVEFGTLVHSVYEAVDPQTPDLAAAIRAAVGAALVRTAPGALNADALTDALLPSYRTPLGPVADGRTLADIGTRDRLAELGFELPLAGGDRTSAELRVGDLAPVLARHLASDDPLAAYPPLLQQPGLVDQPLRGYLTGSIDAVLRVRDADGQPRYLVVDYKTNWLGSADGPVLTLGDYTPARLAEAMMHAHYPLQALLYAVAVHRMLRWRQRGYRPERHLGGAAYLFVRGMAGPTTPVVNGAPCGVFGWRPAPALVVALSDLLDGRPG